MKKETGPGSDISRRQFLAGAGSLLALGKVAPALSVPAAEASKNPDERLWATVPPAAVIVHDPSLCAGCGVCALMCAFFHEKEYGPNLARSELVRDPFTGEHTFRVCRQCPRPACYLACPHRDKALCLDKGTGITYVNLLHCQGCGACSEACPLSPPRIWVHLTKKRAFKCDLCRDRREGPVCVQYCPMKALKKDKA